MMYLADVDISLTGMPALIAIFVVLLIIVVILSLILSPFVILTAITRKKAEDFKRARENTVIAQYDPPQGLSAAQVGLLYDMQCDDKEIMATLFELEQKKVIAINSQDRATVLDENAYQKLQDYEKIAVRMFDKDSSNLDPARTFPITFIDESGTHAVNIPLPYAKSKMQFTAAVQKSLAARGIKMRGYTLSFILRMLLIALLISLWPMVLFSASGGTHNGIEHAAWSWQSFLNGLIATPIITFLVSPVYILASYILLKVYTRIAGRSWLNTRQVRVLWPELEGYRLFLKTADIDKIRFESENAKDGVTTQTLPYAMVFNLETKWQQRLK